MTSEDILGALCGWSTACLWDPLKVLASPNCTATGWDADLLVVYPSDWATEVEIKVSLSDLRRDFASKRAKYATLTTGTKHCIRKEWNEKRRVYEEVGDPVPDTPERPNLVRRFYYAIPLDMLDSALPIIPEWAGIITVERRSPTSRWFDAKKHREAKQLNAVKVTEEHRMQIFKSLHCRYWKHRVKDFGGGV